MIARIYATLATLAAPGLHVWLRHRLRDRREIATRLRERWGDDTTPRPPGPLLWLHAASVGEAVSVLPVLTILAQQTPAPRVLMTTGTVTSAALLARRLPELGLEAQVLHRFVPLDVPSWAERFLEHWRPDVAGFVEQEIWPNLLRACARRGIPTLLLNGRLSAKTSERWSRSGDFARALFGGFERILAQSEEDARRFLLLGGKQVVVAGNLKFAAIPLPAPAAEVERLRRWLAGRPVWLAASTHPGEEEVVLAVHATLAPAHPGLLTIIAPRHPRRGDEILDLVHEAPVARRSLDEDPPASGGVWIVDTLGELGLLYRLAGIAFVGGSLVPMGGQNPLEAARLGCAVAMGPHTENFAEVVGVLCRAGAAVTIGGAADLATWVDALLRDSEQRSAMGDAGLSASRRHGDLPRQVASALLAHLPRPPA